MVASRSIHIDAYKCREDSVDMSDLDKLLASVSRTLRLPKRPEAFEQRLLSVLNEGAMPQLISLGHRMGTLLYTMSLMRCMTVSLAQGGEGLGTLWGGEKAREYFVQLDQFVRLG